MKYYFFFYIIFIFVVYSLSVLLHHHLFYNLLMHKCTYAINNTTKPHIINEATTIITILQVSSIVSFCATDEFHQVQQSNTSLIYISWFCPYPLKWVCTFSCICMPYRETARKLRTPMIHFNRSHSIPAALQWCFWQIMWLFSMQQSGFEHSTLL